MSLTAQDISALLNALELGKLQFSDVISFIDDHYRYSPVEFYNGEQLNHVGTNEGSAKVFGF
ncbi:MAG: HopJ type III effector protein, partial [Moraxella sp.]|nr:HopJ type III effector protein [Moraxella sp.]